jgi:hypothetical protein
MSTYKITNITHIGVRRDFKFNSELDIEYVDNMSKKIIKLKPGKSIYLSIKTLPLSVHRLRLKGLITVEEVDATELAQVMKTSQLTSTKQKKVEENIVEDSDELPKKGGKKKIIKKEEE